MRAYTASMAAYLIRRLWQMVPTLFGVVLLVLLLVGLLVGIVAFGIKLTRR